MKLSAAKCPPPVIIQALKTVVLELLGVALVWACFYHLNVWAFAYFEHNPRVNWIFLPAGIRMMAVFIFGWSGVLGLFVGSSLTNEAHLSADVLVLSWISALSPMLALLACRWFFALPSSLAGLSPRQLIVFSLLGALMNVIFSQLYFFYNDIETSYSAITPMFIGDVLGTLLIFLLVSKALQFLIYLSKNTAE